MTDMPGTVLFAVTCPWFETDIVTVRFCPTETTLLEMLEEAIILARDCTVIVFEIAFVLEI
jgi:hypothetical protein